MYYAHIVLCIYLAFSLCLQLDRIAGIPAGQHTFAMLVDAFEVDVYRARIEMFPNFVEKKIDWIRQISAYLLGLKKRELEDYLAEFLKPENPLDEIGILMFARMMHKHVAVYFNDIYWTTRVDHDCSKCDAHLIYRGKCVYEDSVQLTKDEWDKRKSYLEAFQKAYEDRDNQDPTNSVHSTTTHTVVGSIKTTEPDGEDALLQDLSESLDVTIKKPKKQKPKLKPTRRSKRIKEQDEALNRSIQLSVHSTSKPRTTQNSRKTSVSVAASKSVGVAKNRKGKFDLSNFVLKKRYKKHKPRKCSSCTQLFSSYLKLTEHIKKDHPEFQYKCKYCPKLFNSASWKYQHQDRHKGLRYKCPNKKCAKLFQYGYQLRDHKKKHTRKAMYVCSTRDCLKEFTTKRARTYHEAKHNIAPEDSKNYVCTFKENDEADPCGKGFERKALLEQHARGHKTLKLVSRCGKKKFNWPNSRRYHQQRCDDCKDTLKSTYKYRGSE